MSRESNLHRLKNSWVFFLIEVAAIAAAIVALYIAYFQWREQLLTSSWATLATQVPGASGKVNALEYLVRRGEPVAAIDLSCKTLNGYGTVWTCPVLVPPQVLV